MTRLPAKQATEEDYRRVVAETGDLSLFAPGGTFDCFPGPVVVAGRNGIVLTANAAAAAVVDLLRQGGSEELRTAINAAVDGRAAQVNPLLLPSRPPERGTVSAFDVTVLPWGDGAAALMLGRDITLERSLRAALIESRQRFKELVEATCDFAWETDAEGRFVFVSADVALDYPKDELLGRRALELHADTAGDDDSPFLARAAAREIEIWLRRRDGAAVPLLVTALPLQDGDGEWCGARGLCRDITERRSRAAALAGDRHRERLLAYILGIVRDEMEPARMLKAAAGALVPALPATGVAIFQRDRGGATLCAARVGELPEKSVLDAALRCLELGETQIESVEANGVLLVTPARHDDETRGYICLWRGGERNPWSESDRALIDEIAAQIALAIGQLLRQEELEKLSSTDPLTGILNRRAFLEALEENLAQRSSGERRRRDAPGALLYIDLDNFKPVNDVLGHQRGDEVLVALAQQLRRVIRSGDLVGRLGGDEFAVFLSEVDAAAAAGKAEEIVAVGRKLRPYSADSQRPLGLSLGVAIVAPGDGESLTELLDRADRAMYAAKRRGKGSVEIVSSDEDPQAGAEATA